MKNKKEKIYNIYKSINKTISHKIQYLNSRYMCALHSSAHSRSLCRKFLRQWHQCRWYGCVVWADGGRRGCGGVPADDGQSRAGSRDAAGEWGKSDGHQQTTSNCPGEDVDDHHRHLQPGIVQPINLGEFVFTLFKINLSDSLFPDFFPPLHTFIFKSLAPF